MSRIVHVPYTFYPDPVGGTEIYVEQLAGELRLLGDESLIFAPGTADRQYSYAGMPVHRLAVADSNIELGQLYGEGDPEAARVFGAFLDEHQPDIVHLHAFTRIVSARMAEQAQRRKIPVVFTYHTPTVSCLRSGLMRWGREACDGVLDADLCTRCRLHSLGLPIPAATVLARVPRVVREWTDAKQGGVWTALRMRDLVARQHDAFRSLMTYTDRVVALCEWTRQLLLVNQVPTERIAVVPHGLTVQASGEVRVPPVHPAGKLRIAALGRLEPIKGIHLLVRALELEPSLPLTLDVYGILQSQSETPFSAELRTLVARDERIRLLPPVPHAEVVPLLRHYDLLAVPSQWFETGPLVVLEAFAAGIPVLGADLGGISEKVRDGVDGILVPSLSVKAWRTVLKRLAEDPGLVPRLRANIRPPRSMGDVAQEMQSLYRRLETHEATHRLRPL